MSDSFYTITPALFMRTGRLSERPEIPASRQWGFWAWDTEQEFRVNGLMEWVEVTGSGGSGGVQSVGADAPLVSSGGVNPTISLDGVIDKANLPDFVESVAGSGNIVSSGGLNPVLSLSGIIDSQHLPGGGGKLPKGYISGFEILGYDNLPAPQPVQIGPGICAAADNSKDVILEFGRTLLMREGIGGLIGQSWPANNTWYHVYLVQNTAGTMQDVVASTSHVFTPPAGYETIRCIGSIFYMTDAAGGWRRLKTLTTMPGMRVMGLDFHNSQPGGTILSNVAVPTIPSLSSIDISTFVPPNTILLVTNVATGVGDGQVYVYNGGFRTVVQNTGQTGALTVPYFDKTYQWGKFGGSSSTANVSWRLIAYAEKPL